MVDPAAEERSRQEREREFHDRTYGEGEYDVRPATRFYKVARAGYRFYEDRILDDVAGLRVLEYGCGQGSYAFSLAEAGAAHVTGIDISPVAIDLARQQAKEAGVSDRVEFTVMDAEELAFPDDSFDRICGGGILHHIDLDKGYPEIARTLRSGGRAVFLEALGHNPLINAYRRRTPEQRTEDEHPLLEEDLELASKFFNRVDCRFFNLLTIPAFPFAGVPGFERATASLDGLDQRLFRRFPRLRKHAWMVAVEMS